MPEHPSQRLRVRVAGAVQGVGFRPFVYKLAREKGLQGWVANGMAGVELEVEGAPETLEHFLLALTRSAPPLARISGIEPLWLPLKGYRDFSIRESRQMGPPLALILPDVATCPACIRDITDPTNRRFRYPFTNCTNCGPRYSILHDLPYDRANTTMAAFPMCPACQTEFEKPTDRRFHAQPNACPACGPHLEWRSGAKSISGDEAFRAAVNTLARGDILGVKGMGGFQFLVDATQPEAITRLRARKHREEKPFALMVGSLAQAKTLCHIAPLEERLLMGPEAPIVLLRKRVGAGCDEVAPGNPSLGLMLPSTPLHHILLADFPRPVIATSGNLSEEPLCIGNDEAFERLGAIADAFLVHNRDIVRPVDDSVVRVLVGREQLLRRARGYAPFPIRMPSSVDGTLSVGGHMKNTVALGVGSELFLSQHVGDLASPLARDLQQQTVSDLTRLHKCEPVRVACDLHPDYASTQFADTLGLPVIPIQHHEAHLAACLGEHGLTGPCLGFCWDGTGYGRDGTIWGGEVFDVDAALHFRRVDHLRTFPLPGGERAAREGWRCAAGLLYEAYGPSAFARPRLRQLLPDPSLICAALERGINTPRTSSMGRFFDAVAALLGICPCSRYEGQAAARLEFAAREVPQPKPYPSGGLDWTPMLDAILGNLDDGEDVRVIAARVHATLAETVVTIARKSGRDRVVLSGGCFQNALLTEMIYGTLVSESIEVLIHQRVPPNDGGLAVGQAFLATPETV